MLKASDPKPYILATAALLVAGGIWFFRPQTQPDLATRPIPGQPRTALPPQPAPVPAAPAAPFAPPTAVPAGTQVRIDGSTSMVTINQNLKTGFERKFAGTQVITQARGSGQGLKGLQSGQVDLAAVSRPLTPQETAQGLQAVAIATDPIALVVGINNPFSGSLTPEQVVGIFKGTIIAWSQVGGAGGTIRVVNRPAVSGTHQAFQDLVLKGAPFGTTPNFTALKEDATTPLLRALGNDGIGYATYAQVMNQKTVRVIPIGGIAPLQPNYPYDRALLYVYKNPPSPAVQAFLGYGLSPAGQQVMRTE
jgi:phosphate transport system substrate-binding protein